MNSAAHWCTSQAVPIHLIHASLKKFYSARFQPYGPSSFAITSASATDCKGRMSCPIRNFLLRFVQNHPRQVKSLTSSPWTYINACALHHWRRFIVLFLDSPLLPIAPVHCTFSKYHLPWTMSLILLFIVCTGIEIDLVPFYSLNNSTSSLTRTEEIRKLLGVFFWGRSMQNERACMEM